MSYANDSPASGASTGIEVRVRGLVQGVGFRPTVWRIARELGLAGSVRNDGEGVLIRVWGEPDRVELLCQRLEADCPPLARIDAIERSPLSGAVENADFVIVQSAATAVHTGIVPDASTCAACAGEIADPANRRYRYAFTNCTHCGPRLSIVRGIPYDRANTSMSAFPMCPDCAREYADPADRRFHAQPNACPVCGPRVWLADTDGNAIDPAGLGGCDAIDAASRLLRAGHILAIKGIGGFHLACDATNDSAVAALRHRKRRWRKPFALMARDLDIIRRYCRVSDQEADLLRTPGAPVVLLEWEADADLGTEVAPGHTTLGFMLPYSPLHRLLLQGWERPLIMTSGNSSDEPQCIDNGDALERLRTIADALLLHDRDIVNRIDDSVLRVMDQTPQPLRRARGYAPTSLPLPQVFRSSAPILALGGELKNTICLLQDGHAVLSQHLGDLGEVRTCLAFEQTIVLYRQLFQHRPEVIAVDLHPGYHASQFGRELAVAEGLRLIEVQHHRAHVASVLADNQWPLDAGPVVGIALDGSGYGDDGSVWGGEWLLGDYHALTRVAHLRRVALPGGTRAILEPWRNLFAQIVAGMGWDAFRRDYGALALTAALERRPIGILERMIDGQVNSPLTSSAGRLFDAVAAALDICADGIAYEGQAAVELEAICLGTDGAPGYCFAVSDDSGCSVLDPSPMWRQLFDDLAEAVPAARISARFHAGFADAVTDLSAHVAARHGTRTVALSGGVFQNRTLFERVCRGLRALGLDVLGHHRVPANDGGLALGQAVTAAVIMVADGR